MTEYDFTKPEPIEYDRIEKGMLIMHSDGKVFYLGIAEEHPAYDTSTWVDVNGYYVADKTLQNYLIPKKPKPLPTAGGERIRLTSDHPHASNHPGRIGDKTGACFTLSRHTGNWVLDGHSDSQHPAWFEGTDWEAIKVVPVDA